MIKIALATLLISAQPATACHRFAVWRYPTPQRCGVAHIQRAAYHPPAPAPDKSYFVEIVSPPIPMPKVEPIATDPDPRTPAEIADQKEHDAAVAAHKDEINNLMIILHAKEDAQRAVGIRDRNGQD